MHGRTPSNGSGDGGRDEPEGISDPYELLMTKLGVADIVKAIREYAHGVLDQHPNLSLLLPPACRPATEIGLPAESHAVFTRPQRVWELMIWLEQRIVGLARSAPATGKTTLLKLLAAAYELHGWTVLQCDLRAVTTDAEFEAKFKTQTGITLSAFKQLKATAAVSSGTAASGTTAATALPSAAFLQEMKALGLSWDRLLETKPKPSAVADGGLSDRPIVLLVDEVQQLWPGVIDKSSRTQTNGFFGHLRSLHESRPSNLRVLCFGTFPDEPGGTHAGFGERSGETVGYRHLGLSDVRMTEPEMRALLTIRTTAFNTPPLNRATRRTLWSLTAGHCGILGALLFQIDANFKEESKWKAGSQFRRHTQMAMNDHLSDPTNQTALQSSTRAFSCVKTLLLQLKSDEKAPIFFPELMEAVKFASSDGRISGAAQLAPESLNALFRRGFVSPVNGDPAAFAFVAPVLRSVLIMRIGRKASTMPASCHQLVLDAVQAMRCVVLKNVGQHHTESTFSNEFFSALMARLPESCRVRSDVYSRDRRGRIDYLIEMHALKVRWGIELLHDGNDRANHIRRFDAEMDKTTKKGAEYRKLNLTEHAVIDFRTFSKKFRRSSVGDDHTYTIEFCDPSYSECRIWRGKLSNKHRKCPTQVKTCTETAACTCPRCSPATYVSAASSSSSSATAASGSGAVRKRKANSEPDDDSGDATDDGTTGDNATGDDATGDDTGDDATGDDA